MRFPDEYIVRMFFKEGLQHSPGRVLELGCGSGNNLMLFHEFGWQVVGVDISTASLSDAVHNLSGGGGDLVVRRLGAGHANYSW